MKKIIFVNLILVFILIFSISIFAEEDHRSIDAIIEDIKTEQGVDSKKEIDPKKVSERLLEELGDAAMEEMHPDEKEHGYMDQMMGGEGSESLKAMHINMGYKYLSGNRRGHFGLFGKNSCYGDKHWKGSNRMHGGMWNNNMMGYSGFGGIFMWLIFLLLIGGGIFLTVYLVKRSGLAGSGDTAEDIAKKRLAKGEITQDQYDAIIKKIK